MSASRELIDAIKQVCYQIRSDWNEAMRGVARELSKATGTNDRHGTRAGYNHDGCRCDACRAAGAEYMREYRRKRKEANR